MASYERIGAVIGGANERSDAAQFDAAFRRLFDERFLSLFRYLDRLTGDPDLAADLAQEAFVRLHRRGALPDDARAWLITVAFNLLRDQRRGALRRRLILAREPVESTLGAPQPAPDVAAIAEEQRAAVRETLDRLTSRDRRMLLLRHEGHTYREIALALEIPETSVGTMLVRATAAFRAAFVERHRASD